MERTCSTCVHFDFRQPFIALNDVLQKAVHGRCCIRSAPQGFPPKEPTAFCGEHDLGRALTGRGLGNAPLKIKVKGPDVPHYACPRCGCWQLVNDAAEELQHQLQPESPPYRPWCLDCHVTMERREACR